VTIVQVTSEAIGNQTETGWNTVRAHEITSSVERGKTLANVEKACKTGKGSNAWGVGRAESHSSRDAHDKGGRGGEREWRTASMASTMWGGGGAEWGKHRRLGREGGEGVGPCTRLETSSVAIHRVR